MNLPLPCLISSEKTEIEIQQKEQDDKLVLSIKRTVFFILPVCHFTMVLVKFKIFLIYL